MSVLRFSLSTVYIDLWWGVYGQSASEAIFRARTLIQSGDDDYSMNETRRNPTTGRQSPCQRQRFSAINHITEIDILVVLLSPEAGGCMIPGRAHQASSIKRKMRSRMLLKDTPYMKGYLYREPPYLNVSPFIKKWIS